MVADPIFKREELPAPAPRRVSKLGHGVTAANLCKSPPEIPPTSLLRLTGLLCSNPASRAEKVAQEERGGGGDISPAKKTATGCAPGAGDSNHWRFATRTTHEDIQRGRCLPQ